MTKGRSWVALAALVGAAGLMGWGGEAAAQKLAGREVKLGAMVPLTGKGAEWGQTAKIAIELAAEEINAKGGIGGVPLKVIYVDYEAKEAEGLKLVERLATRDDVLAVIGPCFSSVFEVIAPKLDRLGVIINSYCSSKPGLSAMSKWAFRNTLTSDKQLEPVVKAWAADYKIKKAVVIHDIEDAVSRAEGEKILPVLLKQNGVEVLDMLTYRTKDTDFSAQITKAKSLNPDGIALGSCYQQAAGLAKEAKKQGLNAPFIGGACAGAPGYIQLGGAATEGHYMSTAAWLEDPRPQVQEFVKKYLPRNEGKAPPYGAPRAYDIVYITKQVIETSGVTNKPGDLVADRDKIRAGWAKVKGYNGVAGEVTMDENRDGAGSSAILKVANGKFVNAAMKK
jgi:branched-chain amino acid transport system substrate-binding protein